MEKYGPPFLWDMVVIFFPNNGIEWNFVLHDIVVGYEEVHRVPIDPGRKWYELCFFFRIFMCNSGLPVLWGMVVILFLKQNIV